MQKQFKIGLILLIALAAFFASAYYHMWAPMRQTAPLTNYPSITSTSTDVSCKTGACTISPAGATTTKPVITKPTQPKAAKKVMTTVFWIGEPSDADNDYIPNDVSAWDGAWQKNYGGVDSPDCRVGFSPCGFAPKQNPFYFALPYNDLGVDGHAKPTQKLVPWYSDALFNKNMSVLKNHWIKITYGAKTCYAQWEDVGPNEEDDFNYVFGNSQPKNTFGEKAGLDLSPAAFSCLGLKDNAETYWAFVDEKDVPPGPWRDTVTVSAVAW